MTIVRRMTEHEVAPHRRVLGSSNGPKWCETHRHVQNRSGAPSVIDVDQGARPASDLRAARKPVAARVHLQARPPAST